MVGVSFCLVGIASWIAYVTLAEQGCGGGFCKGMDVNIEGFLWLSLVFLGLGSLMVYVAWGRIKRDRRTLHEKRRPISRTRHHGTTNTSDDPLDERVADP